MHVNYVLERDLYIMHKYIYHSIHGVTKYLTLQKNTKP